ncbi:MAG: PQQ-dependent sugar dehydrogenase [Gammaproteobacteria bacterium]
MVENILQRSIRYLLAAANHPALLQGLLLLLCCSTVPAGAARLAYENQTITIDGDTWTLRVPAGLRLEALTTKLDKPRLMSFLPNGDLIIGSRSGKVYRLAPPYTRPEVLVKLADYPHSVAYRNGELFIAQTDGLYRAPYKPGQRTLDRDDLERVAKLPGGRGHNSRTVGVGPDGRVYVALGISGNCSNEYLDNSYRFDDRRGGVFVLDETGARPLLVPFASGLRNPVGFAWHPDTGVLYASNNGPDHLGYDTPPEYFSKLTAGSFHGMPWFQFDGTNIQRDTCIRRDPPRPLAEVVKPVATFPARNAPMGVAFIPGGALGNRFTGNAVVALRGSWGTRPRGSGSGDPATRRPPRLMMVHFDKGEAFSVADFVSGFQRPNGTRLARPVGVAIGPDGALYFTSDSETQGLFRLAPAANQQ